MRQFCPNRFKNKVIVLADAAGGIGKVTAIRAAEEGAKLVLTDRLKEEGERVFNAVRAGGGTAIFLNLNLSAEERIEQVVDAAVRTYEHLGIAINNAGVMGSPSSLHELEQEQVDYTTTNNFYSVFFCCKHKIREFVKGGSEGVIVSDTSITRSAGLSNNPTYVASEHAVDGLTKNLALDYAKHGIRINPVNPAGTTTPAVVETCEYAKDHKETATKTGIDPAKAQSMAERKFISMLERRATAEGQTTSIPFLVLDGATRMMGVTVRADGGWASF